ncbi:MAG: non-ribosomal peptide synthetase, partial [Clostridia bacterium]|nr:non-ribosomal peptide synthetase [Clostridia bacterium]
DAVKMPVSVDVWPEDGSYVLAVEYDGTRYGKQEMLRFAKALQAVSESLAEAEKVGDAVLTDAEERERVLSLSRGEELPYDENETWIDLFQKQVKRAPDHPAVTDRNSSYTYAELDKASDRIAGWLIRNGVKENTFVAIQMGRVKEFIATEMGIHKAGAGYVPIDPEYPQDRIDYMLGDAGAGLLLTEEKVREILAEPAADWDGRSRATPESLAYMIYTSGSTGQPKGVVILQRCLTNYAHVIGKHWQLSEQSRITIHAGLAVDFAGEDLFPTLCAGGSVYIVPEEVRKDVFAMREYLAENRITGGSFYTQFGQLMGKDEELDLDYISIGGEAMTSIPKVRGRVLNAYGPTEFTVDAVFHEIDPNRTYDTIPIGRPLDNCAGYILDGSLHLLPAGMAGELCLAGPQMAQGYWKRPELTAEKFCESADLPGIRIYRTGDLARYNERGEMEYLGRIDTQVKLRGFRIELGEIENRAIQYGRLKEAAAAVKKEQVVLYYTTEDDIEMDTAELRGYLSERLTDYMVPTVYMKLEKMPLNTSGKIDRKALPEPVLADLGEIVPPETETEKALFEIAAGILGTEEFGVTTDLVALGLSSIGAMRLASETAQRLGMRVGTAEILKQPTIR